MHGRPKRTQVSKVYLNADGKPIKEAGYTARELKKQIEELKEQIEKLQERKSELIMKREPLSDTLNKALHKEKYSHVDWKNSQNGDKGNFKYNSVQEAREAGDQEAVKDMIKFVHAFKTELVTKKGEAKINLEENTKELNIIEKKLAAKQKKYSETLQKEQDLNAREAGETSVDQSHMPSGPETEGVGSQPQSDQDKKLEDIDLNKIDLHALSQLTGGQDTTTTNLPEAGTDAGMKAKGEIGVA